MMCKIVWVKKLMCPIFMKSTKRRKSHKVSCIYICNFFDEFFGVPTNALLYNGLEFFNSKSPNFGKKFQITFK